MEMWGKAIASVGPAGAEAQRQSPGPIWMSEWSPGMHCERGLEEEGGRLRQTLKIRSPSFSVPRVLSWPPTLALLLRHACVRVLSSL